MKIKRKILIILIVLIFICCSNTYATEFNTIIEVENIIVESNTIIEEKNIFNEKEQDGVLIDDLNRFETDDKSEKTKTVFEIIDLCINITRVLCYIIGIIILLNAIIKLIRKKTKGQIKYFLIIVLISLSFFIFANILGLINGPHNHPIDRL